MGFALMKIQAYRSKSGQLSAANKKSWEYIQSLKQGQPVEMSIHEVRTLNFHRMVFGLADLLVKNAPDDSIWSGKTAEFFIKSSMLTHGFCEECYNISTGEIHLYPLSINFSNCSQAQFEDIWQNAICVDAAAVFDREPEWIAKHYEELFEEYGDGKGGYCEACYDHKWTQLHHKFQNTEPHRKYYGKKNIVDRIDWLNDKRNLMRTCEKCNTSHAGQGEGLIIWSEKEFCDAMGIEPRMKNSNS